MLGAIIGDIVGSVYEWDNHRSKEFPLFSPRCDFTDDSVMTFAVAEGLLSGGTTADYAIAMQRLGRRYPGRGYGGRFAAWLEADDPQPYMSFGNGSAMRVSPVAWACRSLKEAEETALLTAMPTHDHPEGVKGAQAVAAAIYLARCSFSKEKIKDYIEERFGYDLHRRLDDIRPVYRFNETCQETVPEAIIAFLESTGFEDAIRCGVSLGGDSDTLTAITGSIAEAAYGIPADIRAAALAFLPEEFTDILHRFGKIVVPAAELAVPDIQ